MRNLLKKDPCFDFLPSLPVADPPPSDLSSSGQSPDEDLGAAEGLEGDLTCLDFEGDELLFSMDVLDALGEEDHASFGTAGIWIDTDPDGGGGTLGTAKFSPDLRTGSFKSKGGGMTGVGTMPGDSNGVARFTFIEGVSTMNFSSSGIVTINPVPILDPDSSR